MVATDTDSRQLEYYWATEPDPLQLVQHVRERIRDFYEVAREIQAWTASIRSWRYYHGLYFPDAIDQTNFAIKNLGEEGEVAGISVNHYRALISQVVALATQRKLKFTAKATNSEQQSIDSARLGAQLAEHYTREKLLGKRLRTAAEQALVLRVGFTLGIWDPNLGETTDYADDAFDAETGELQDESRLEHQGDMRFSNPSLFDVIFDPTVGDWEEVRWIAVRIWENRWDLAARYPEFKDELLRVDAYERDQQEYVALSMAALETAHTDRIPTWHFYHVPTDALPEGRYCLFAGSQATLLDTLTAGLPYPYEGLPLARLTAGEILLTAFGYTPAFDLQGLAEALNAEVSTVATNHKNYGFNKVWTRSGDVITREVVDETTVHYQSETKPEPMSLLIANPEVLQLAQFLIQQMEYLSGINSARRGIPPGKETSGTALAVLHAQAVEFASAFLGSYSQHAEDVGTHLVRTLRRYMKSDRVFYILGLHNRTEALRVTSEDLGRVDRVIVESGNAMTDTLAGRLQLAEWSLKMGFASSVEQLQTLIDSGNIEPLFESQRRQVTRIRLENEALLQGEDIPPVAATDYHLLDIREHASLLSDPQIRRDAERVARIMGHVTTHMEMLMNPGVQVLQVALGYPNPLLALGAPAPGGEPGAPGGAPGKPPAGAGGKMPQAGPGGPQAPADVPVRPAEPPRPPRVPVGAGAANAL